MQYQNDYYYKQPYQMRNGNGTKLDDVQFVCNFDPYVYQTLQTVIGSTLMFETTRGNIIGKVLDVKPDHVVVDNCEKTIFIRIAEIVTMMPL